jgi:hypothetical protein
LSCFASPIASKVSDHLAGHRLWLEQGFDDQVFFLTGGIPQAGGGAVLAAGLSRDDLTRRVTQDGTVALADPRAGGRLAS